MRFSDTGEFFGYSPAYLSSHEDASCAEIVNPTRSLEDTDLQEGYLKYLIEDCAKEDLSQTPLLSVETPLESNESRRKFVELIFERFSGCGVAIYRSALLTSYLYSKENSLIVDIGANYTHITPIFEGFVIPKGTPR